MNRYLAYSEYKDSGSTWLEPIPSHWIATKFGYTKSVLTDYTANGSFADLKKNVTYLSEPEGYARLVRLTDLRKNLKNSDGVWISEKAYNYLSKSSLHGSEFLLANVGAYAGLFYQMPETDVPASLAPNMFMAKFDDSKVCSRFIAYIGQSHSAHSQLRLLATASSAQPKLNKDDFKSVVYPLPPKEEQTRIANFLDHETTKIDTLIEKQQQLIKLLKEKRQAVISHAVTKGLNPDAPMKDSGVEWLGEVPEHWKVSALGYYSNLNTGATPDRSKPSYWEGDIPWIKTGEVRYKKISITEEFITDEAVSNSSVRISPPGTLLMAMYGQGITRGRVALLGVSAAYNQACVAINPIKEVSNEFLYFYFMAAYHALRDGGNETSQMNLNADIVRKFVITVPSKDEQEAIILRLEKELIRYDQLINKAQHSIDLSSERRTALISAAVTGKIDVRSWQQEQSQVRKEATV